MTSYIVLSCALGELNLLTSKLGRLAMSAYLISAIFSTFLYGFFLAFRLAENGKGLDKAIYSFLIFIGISITLISVARVFVVWLISKAPESRFLDEARFITILMIALAGCLATEIAGYHGALGAFIFGLALPGGAPLGVTMVERLDRLVTGIFLPVFVALAGIRMDLITLFADMSRWGYFQAFVSVSVVGKFVGTIVPCLYFKMHWKDAMILGLIMNIKGIREIDYSAQWQDTKIVDNQEYTILMSSVIFLGGATSILVKYFYRPEDRFVAYKRRTIYHSKPGDELRVVSCIHSQSDVSLTLSLLDASYPTTSCPLCVYLIHLMELAGRTEAILRPHKVRRSQTRKINSYAADSDRIVNAFNAFERQNTTGSVSMIPYICISPYNTMHEDICSLAYDKKTVLVLIPFHQRYSVNGTAEPHNPSLLNLNLNVLSYAPCSVGILIDRGGSTAELLNHQVAMYFMGGRDDREALALATRMADNPAVGLTVMRFRKSSERGLSSSPDSKDNDEERLDEEVIDEFIRESVDNQRVVYREDVVKRGDELVDAIRQTSGMFSLLIVGRNEKKGKAKESCSIMAGLSAWSENPELGVLGDLLASTDFGCVVPTLVVQQQALIGNCVQQSDDQVSHLPDDTP
ncbi:hypothetical protein LUZ60_011701 [Juncus effusus]|nr:hypothetical protein LUZ60_011701 [Juncus effusus]